MGIKIYRKELLARVQTHGVAAAARRFGIPPPVASYYHRKHWKTQQNGTFHILIIFPQPILCRNLAVQQQAVLAAAAAAGINPQVLLAGSSGGPMAMARPTGPASSAAPPTPTTPDVTPQHTPANTQPSTPQPQSCEMVGYFGLWATRTNGSTVYCNKQLANTRV